MPSTHLSRAGPHYVASRPGDPFFARDACIERVGVYLPRGVNITAVRHDFHLGLVSTVCGRMSDVLPLPGNFKVQRYSSQVSRA